MSAFGRILAAVVWRFVPPNREPDFLIGPSQDNPYMKRWWLIPRNRVFNIYLHHMLQDDDDRAPHDHPWWSLSLCLSGHIQEFELVEWNDKSLCKTDDIRIKHGVYKDQVYRVNQISQGDFKWRGKEYAHRLTLPKGDAWTLFITGPNARTWGFHCPKGWVPWKQFVDSDKPGQPGRGCGENE